MVTFLHTCSTLFFFYSIAITVVFLAQEFCDVLSWCNKVLSLCLCVFIVGILPVFVLFLFSGPVVCVGLSLRWGFFMLRLWFWVLSLDSFRKIITICC